MKSQYTRFDLMEAGVMTGLAKDIGKAATTGAFTMPVDVAKGFIGFLTNTTFSKSYWEKNGAAFKELGKLFLGTYAYLRAPSYVKQFMRKMIKYLPHLRARLINLWTLIYPDLETMGEKEQKYNVIMYSPVGRILARRTISEEDAKEFIEQSGESEGEGLKPIKKARKVRKAAAKQEKEPASDLTGKFDKKLAKAQRQVAKLENNESISLDDFLDLTEQEILSEALGLPPLKIIADKLRFSEDLRKPCPKCHGTGYIVKNGQKVTCPVCQGTGSIYAAKIAPTIIRFRLWIVQVYDERRNKTYLFVFDTVSPPDKQPVDKWSYEGKQDII